jgi:hypothetical protein
MNQGLMRARRRKTEAGAEAEAGTALFHEKMKTLSLAMIDR